MWYSIVVLPLYGNVMSIINVLEEQLMKLNSKQYPDITYEEGEEIYLREGNSGLPFRFDVEDCLTEDEDVMNVIAHALDDMHTLKQKAKDYLKKSLADSESEDYDTISCFMEFHRDDIDSELTEELFDGVEDPSELSFEDMVDYLEVCGVSGMMYYEEEELPVIMMEFSFDPDITDELMVIYFDFDYQIISVSHES